MSPLEAERLLPSLEKSSGQGGGCLISWLTSVGPTTAQAGVRPRNMWQPQLVVLGNFEKREKQVPRLGGWELPGQSSNGQQPWELDSQPWHRQVFLGHILGWGTLYTPQQGFPGQETLWITNLP